MSLHTMIFQLLFLSALAGLMIYFGARTRNLPFD